MSDAAFSLMLFVCLFYFCNAYGRIRDSCGSFWRQDQYSRHRHIELLCDSELPFCCCKRNYVDARNDDRRRNNSSVGEYPKGIVIMARWSKQKRKKALGTTLFSGYYGLFLIFI